jgi:hypothetical protein
MINRSIRLLFLVSFCLTLLLAQKSFASTAIQPSDLEMVVSARAIVIGEVSDISTGIQHDRVYSYIRLKVDEVLKGSSMSSEIVLKQLGGEHGDLGTLIYGMPKFELGKKVLVYLDTWRDGSFRVHQMFLGKFDITTDSSTNKLIVSRDHGENVQVINREGTVSTRIAELDAYKEKIGNLYGANYLRAQKFEQEAYGTIPMLAEPPEYASVRKAGQISPQWVTINPAQPPRWFEADSGQTLRFFVNTDGAPSKGVVDDVDAAINAWADGTNLRFAFGGETGSCAVGQDGTITVVFNNCDNSFSRTESGCSGLLGIGGISKYIPSQSKSVNGVTFYKAIEGTVSINPNALCNIMNRCDLQETLTHELGHALGLGHTSDELATMWPITHFDNRCGGLLGDDVEGIRFMYGTGGALNIDTGSELLPATVNLPYASKLDATGGSGSHTWQITNGRLPSGLRLSSNGTLSGFPLEPGIFNFSAQVRDTSGRSAQAGFNLNVRFATPAPAISNVVYQKKKVIVTGENFSPSGTLYINSQQRFATLSGNKVQTDKGKLKRGTYVVQIVNSDGTSSNSVTLIIE